MTFHFIITLTKILFAILLKSDGFYIPEYCKFREPAVKLQMNSCYSLQHLKAAFGNFIILFLVLILS